jgi:hypothetical protein
VRYTNTKTLENIFHNHGAYEEISPNPVLRFTENNTYSDSEDDEFDSKCFLFVKSQKIDLLLFLIPLFLFSFFGYFFRGIVFCLAFFFFENFCFFLNTFFCFIEVLVKLIYQISKIYKFPLMEKK